MQAVILVGGKGTRLGSVTSQLAKPLVAVNGEAMLDRQLANHPFIAGDSYSIADITALVATDFMKPARIPRPAGLPDLDRWYGAVSTRPSASA